MTAEATIGTHRSRSTVRMSAWRAQAERARCITASVTGELTRPRAKVGACNWPRTERSSSARPISSDSSPATTSPRWSSVASSSAGTAPIVATTRPSRSSRRRATCTRRRTWIGCVRTGSHVIEIEKGDLRTPEQLRAAEAATLAAMQAGADVVFQATFFDGRWRGHADFLFKDSTGRPVSARGATTSPTPSSRVRSRVAPILQMCVYADLLERLQGVPPDDAVGHHRRWRQPPASDRRLRAVLPIRQGALRGARGGRARRRYRARIRTRSITAACAPGSRPASIAAGPTITRRSWPACRGSTRSDSRLAGDRTLTAVAERPLGQPGQGHARRPTCRRLREQARRPAPQAAHRRVAVGAHRARPDRSGQGPGHPARAIAVGPVLRHRGRPVGDRGRPGVPARRGRDGRRRAHLPRHLGDRPGPGTPRPSWRSCSS